MDTHKIKLTAIIWIVTIFLSYFFGLKEGSQRKETKLPERVEYMTVNGDKVNNLTLISNTNSTLSVQQK
jgi:hypothetical protein